MSKKVFALLAAIILTIIGFNVRGGAQAVSSSSYTATITSGNHTQALICPGASAASILFTGSGTGLTSTVQVSSDNGTTWETAAAFTAPVNGTTDTASIAGYNEFRVNVTALTGTDTYFESCGPGVSYAPGTYPTPIPTPVPTAAATAAAGQAPANTIQSVSSYSECYRYSATPAPASNTLQMCPADAQGVPYVDAVGATPVPYATINPHILEAAPGLISGASTVQQSVAGDVTENYAGVGVCGLTSQNCAPITTNSGALAVNNVLGTYATGYGYNGTSWIQNRSDPATTITGYQSVTVGPSTETNASAASGTCQAVVTGGTRLVHVMFASSSAQTGTLTIYNEGASPTCAAGDIVYVSATHSAASVPDVLNLWLSAGLAYKWTTAAETGVVLLGYN